MPDTCEQAIEILQATEDGDQLAGEHLALVEAAVNGFLNEAGKLAFEKLHTDVKAGVYRWPWFKGIEHLTLDHVGYVLWKGHRVEHFELPYAYSEESTEYAKEVAHRCTLLEGKGVTPSVRSVVWTWEER